MNKICIVMFTFLSYHIVLSADKPCGQHELKINYLRNCPGKGNFLIIQNLSISLTDDCRVVPRGCYQVKKKTSDIKVIYHASKPPLLNKNGTEDLCKIMSNADFQKSAAQYKVDSKCPIEVGQYCITKGSTFVEQLNPAILNMAVGVIRARAELISEKNKAKACMEMEAVVSKKKH